MSACKFIMPNKLRNEWKHVFASKDTYMAPMVAPTKRAPNVSPREGITGKGCEDIAGYKDGVEVALGYQLIDG